ncbi:M55 family metallopeptidase [Chelativorans sp. M5D2P16]|uniref:M55 family metallopeptidase n=1 Tax=Chelativorans sp. M5D2P16 TaxID=3095678 RepID=UPI002ACA42A2|nr:M55 family metallopeptidase [Chelativorans sp. M5D2P16]MDZ5695983.1 M55 family metallopeptidase [Chelativorans sp. M5D2P16]
MNIFISVDIEGVAGVSEPIQGQRGNAEYEIARRLMTEEANAAIRGAFAAGARAVTVADSHGPMRNMIADALDPRAMLVSGKPRPLSMIQGIHEGHDGAVLIGYHAAAGNRGVLAHTISGLAFARIEMNGVPVGEPTLFAGHAAEIGVPLLAVSGDDRLGEEIRTQFPNARVIETKTALGAQASRSLSPHASRDLIEREVRTAVEGAAGQRPHAPCQPPLEVVVTFNRQVFADAACLVPEISRRGATEVVFTAGSHADAIGILAAFSILAQGLS